MTNPKHTDTSRSGDLVERARAKWKALPTQGGGSVAIGGQASHYVTDDGMRLINPDGPALADRIEALEAEIKKRGDMVLHMGANTAEMANQYRDRIEALEAEVPKIIAWLRAAGYNQIAAAIEAGEYKEKSNA